GRVTRTAALTATLLVAPLLAVAAPAPTAVAASAPCPADGAVVLVDFRELADSGEGTRIRCDRTAEGERAGTSIADAGFELEEATRNPGFVCRVQGVPASESCVNAAPADAY